MQSWDGFDDYSDTIISNKKGVLSVFQQGVAEDVITGDSNRLLRFELKSLNADISVNEIKAKRTGSGLDSDVGGIRLEDEDKNTIVSGTISNGEVTFRPDMVLSEGEAATVYIVVDINSNAPDENSIGFTIMNKGDVKRIQELYH